MEEFIRDTKHRQREYDTEDGMEHVNRKLISTLVPKFVDWQKIYHFVDSDLNSINFRAPEVLSSYANIKYFDPEWLDQILSPVDNRDLIKNNDTVKHYIDAMQPIPEGKELYVLFLHGQKQKNLAEHLDYLYGTDNKVEKTRLSNAINLYQPIFDEHTLTKDIGILVKNIQCGVCGKHKAEEEEEEEKKEEEEETKSKIDVKTVLAKPWDKDTYKNPILETFRVNNNLSSRYSTTNLIKQIVVSTVTTPENAVKVLQPIMGKYQNGIILNENTNEEHEDLLFFVDYLPDETIASLIEVPAVQSFYYSCKTKPETDRDWIKMLIKSHMPAYRDSIIISKKFYDNSQELGKEIVQLLIV